MRDTTKYECYNVYIEQVRVTCVQFCPIFFCARQALVFWYELRYQFRVFLSALSRFFV